MTQPTATEAIHLTTERLTLRPMLPEDAEAVFEYRTLPEVSKYLLWRPAKVQDLKERWAGLADKPNITGTWYNLLMYPTGSNTLIGDTGIHFIDDHQVEIGYVLNPQHQGKGYAAEAMQAVVNYIFTTLGKHRITASVDPDNAASIKLLQKLNMLKEAHFKKSLLHNGKWVDDCIYAILREDWLAEQPPSPVFSFTL
jgi:RimJ/RimL family protein N-acetyltransferase